MLRTKNTDTEIYKYVIKVRAGNQDKKKQTNNLPRATGTKPRLWLCAARGEWQEKRIGKIAHNSKARHRTERRRELSVSHQGRNICSLWGRGSLQDVFVAAAILVRWELVCRLLCPHYFCMQSQQQQIGLAVNDNL